MKHILLFLLLLLLLLLPLVFTSCKKEEPIISSQAEILIKHNWQITGVVTYNSSQNTSSAGGVICSASGIWSFTSDGRFKISFSVGNSCGTSHPPFYSGTWRIEENKVKILFNEDNTKIQGSFLKITDTYFQIREEYINGDFSIKTFSAQ